MGVCVCVCVYVCVGESAVKVSHHIIPYCNNYINRPVGTNLKVRGHDCCGPIPLLPLPY